MTLDRREATRLYSARLYQKRKAARECAQCGSKLLPEWGIYCPECADYHSRWTRTRKGRAARRRYLRKRDVRLRERARKQRRQWANKVRGICKDCRKPALEDSVYCHDHREVHRAANRDYQRRRRQAEKLGVPFEPRKGGRPRSKPIRLHERARPMVAVQQVTSTPIADWKRGDLGLQAAVQRFVELCNGITREVAADEFGIHKAVNPTERNTFDKAIERLLAAGKIVDEGRMLYGVDRQRRAA